MKVHDGQQWQEVTFKETTGWTQHQAQDVVIGIRVIACFMAFWTPFIVAAGIRAVYG